MSSDAWISLGMVGLLTVLLALTTLPADMVMIGCLTVLLVLGVVTPTDALSGLSNPSMVTIGVLYVVVSGLRRTGAIAIIGERLLGRPRSTFGAQLRLMTPVIGLSAFINNTPVVAMLIPAVLDWAKRHRLSVSKLLIPLSYASILGGTCTLIGTSTNLVVSSLMAEEAGLDAVGMFEIAWVGLPAAVLGLGFILLFSQKLLPERRPPISQADDPREYTTEMLVPPSSPLIGKTLQEAGLRHLPGAYIAEIERDGQVTVAVSSEERLRADDRLVFVGVVETVVDLQKSRGLIPATDQVFKLDTPRSDRCLIEAVVSDSCPLVGKTIRDGRFRSVYNAAIIAVARNGVRLRKKIGDIILTSGDTLLIEAKPSFAELQRDSRDFFLVSRIEDSQPPRHERALVALAILAAMVAAVTTGWLDILPAAMLAAGFMIMTRCCRGADARRSVDWQVLLVIAAALGIGKSLQQTGAAAALADALIGLGGNNPRLALLLIYLVTAIFTATITNVAAAALVFPIALATAQNLDANFLPFAMTIMMAASASFATPIGYQTNMMVFGPGGYRFSDYLRIGLPLTVLVGAVTILLAPVIWPF